MAHLLFHHNGFVKIRKSAETLDNPVTILFIVPCLEGYLVYTFEDEQKKTKYVYRTMHTYCEKKDLYHDVVFFNNNI